MDNFLEAADVVASIFCLVNQIVVNSWVHF